MLPVGHDCYLDLEEGQVTMVEPSGDSRKTSPKPTSGPQRWSKSQSQMSLPTSNKMQHVLPTVLDKLESGLQQQSDSGDDENLEDVHNVVEHIMTFDNSHSEHSVQASMRMIYTRGEFASMDEGTLS